MKNRRGIIKISDHFIKNPQESKEFLSVLFSQFFPVRIDPDFDGLVYKGYCEQFDEITEGTTIPGYDVVFHTEGNSYRLEMKKI